MKQNAPAFETNGIGGAVGFFTKDLQAALITILADVINYPKYRPFSGDGHLTVHLIERAWTSVVANGFNMASLRTEGGAA